MPVTTAYDKGHADAVLKVVAWLERTEKKYLSLIGEYPWLTDRPRDFNVAAQVTQGLLKCLRDHPEVLDEVGP